MRKDTINKDIATARGLLKCVYISTSKKEGRVEPVTIYSIGFVVVVYCLYLLFSGPLDRKPYRCSKCGFETYSEIEATGHEKLENAHKVS